MNPIIPLPKGVDMAGGELRFTQDGDTTAGPDIQSLTVEVVDSGAGLFLAIHTERWSLDYDGMEAFAALLRGVAAAFPDPSGPGGESGPGPAPDSAPRPAG